MPAKLETLVQERLRRAYRAPIAWTQAGSPHIIFTVVGGPVWIKGYFLHTNLVQGAGATLLTTCNGAAWDAGAGVAVGVAAGGFMVWSLGAPVPILAVMTPMPTTLSLVASRGVVASPDAVDPTISITVGVFDFANPVSFYCLYYALSPNARII
jgi:hypothetical protein